jgi:hypothetical protein
MNHWDRLELAIEAMATVENEGKIVEARDAFCVLKGHVGGHWRGVVAQIDQALQGASGSLCPIAGPERHVESVLNDPGRHGSSDGENVSRELLEPWVVATGPRGMKRDPE